MARLVRLAFRYPGGALGLFITVLLSAVLVLGPLVWRVGPDERDLSQALQRPSIGHPLGTDQLGRDMLSRVLHGGRLSLLIGVSSVVLGMVIGVTLGTTAGVHGSWLEVATMRLVDALLALPGIVQAVIFVAILGRGISPLIVALGIYSVPIFARLTYSATRELMGREYIEAAWAVGASSSRVLFRHILPNITTPVVTVATLRVGSNILIGAALNFFGLGVQPPAPEWGLMIAEGRSHSWSSPHLILYPGLLLFIVCLGFNLLGDALRDWLDPKLARG